MLHHTSETVIRQMAVHKTGNQNTEELPVLSDSTISLPPDLEELLLLYFLKPFKSDLLYHFDLEENPDNKVYRLVSDIFENPDKLLEHSKELVKYLFEQSTHPQIRNGEFFAVYFTDCDFKGENREAIGLFKSENKDTFLKIETVGEDLAIKSENGISINKLDKGCLIFNIDKDNGYQIEIIDNTNRNTEAQYWTESFLHICQKRDEYFHTQQVMSMCKDYITKELPQEFEVNKADQIDLLNRSVKFFKDNDSFDLGEFTEEVLTQPEVIDSFTSYKKNYEQEKEIEIADRFTISDNAIKKQTRVFKSVIKLDKNFHIYVHGNRELIEQGTDDKGRKFYKIFYQEEN